MIAILCAFQFLTILPPIIRRSFTAQELGRSVAFYPLVGLTFGGVLYGVAVALDSVLSPYLLAVILLSLWLILTRGLHFDGFLDACDGLFGGTEREQRLEIMRDERLGAYAFTGGFFLLGLKFFGLGSLPLQFLLAAPVIGRWCMAWIIVVFPYTRPSGLGKWMKDNAGWPQLVVAALTTVVVLFWVMGWSGLMILAAITMVTSLVCLWVNSRINGMTGDVYGAICELSELLFLLSVQIGMGAAWLS